MPEIHQIFKKALKLFLRAFIRRETTNLNLKIETALQIINIYREVKDQHLPDSEKHHGFFYSTSLEIAHEFSGVSSQMAKPVSEIEQNNHKFAQQKSEQI